MRYSSVRKLLILEREMGLEPTTSSLGSWHSTTELLPLLRVTSVYLNPPCALRMGAAAVYSSIPKSLHFVTVCRVIASWPRIAVSAAVAPTVMSAGEAAPFVMQS